MLTETERQSIDHKPVCLFSRRGELIWRSSAWTKPGPRRDDQVLGTRFHEFIFKDDLPGLLDWLAGDDLRPFTFGCMLPKSGQTARVTYEKVASGEDWLCVGLVEVIPPPATQPARLSRT